MKLLSPISFRNGVTLRNRVALAPLTNSQSAADGTLGDDEYNFLRRRATGGFGLIETCASHVAADGQGFPGELGCFADRLLPGLSQLASGIAATGAIGIVQLFHGGVRAPQELTGQQPFSASSFADPTPGFVPPRPASEEDLARVIAEFRAAALRALHAGFHGVEVHGAHGYLFGQFLSRTMNLRSDGWGGSLEGRARLLRQTVQAIRAVVPDSFVVGVRISPEDFGQARGLDLDESVQVGRWLVEDQIDYLHLSLWNVAHNSRKYPDRHPIDLFRAAVADSVKLVVAGSIWTVADAEAQLDRGADIVSLGRAAIANPDWPQRAADPSFVPRRPPLDPAELAALDVGPTFVSYLRRFRDFVK